MAEKKSLSEKLYGKEGNIFQKLERFVIEQNKKSKNPVPLAGPEAVDFAINLAMGATTAPVKYSATTPSLINLLKNLIKKPGQALEKTGESLRGGVVKPKIPASPFGAREEQAVVSGLEKLGLKGSAGSQYKKLPDVMEYLSSKILDIFKKTPQKVVSRKTVESFIKGKVDESINFVPGDKAFQAARDRVLGRLKGTKFSGEALFNFKKELGNRLSNAFNKLRKGNPLTPAEGVEMAVWESLDDLITKNFPKVKDLTRQQSVLFRAAPGLQKSAQTAGVKIPLTEMRVGGGVLQTGQDVLGRLLQGGGRALQSPVGAGLVAGGAGVLALQKLLGSEQPSQVGTTETPQTTESSAESILSPQGQWKWDAQANDWVPNTQTENGQSSGITREAAQKAMVADLLATGGKNIADIKAIYDIGSANETADVKKRKGAVQSAELIYDQVSELALSAPSGLGGYLRAVAGKLPGVEGGSAEDLKRVTEGFAKAIASAFAKEVGVATDQDIQRWLGLMPKPGDTQAERVRALSRLKEAIDAEKSNLGLQPF